MKRMICLLTILCTTLAAADTVSSYRYSTENQILSRAAPTLVTEGMSLQNIAGYQITITAPSGQTITGGTLECYYMSTYTFRWARCSSSMDLTPRTGGRDWTSPNVEVAVGLGRVLYAAASITLSGGTTVDVSIEARGR